MNVPGVTTRRALVAGIGNEFRGDDAAGVLVARELARAGIPDTAVSEESGDIGHMLEAWEGYDIVVLVDAVSSGQDPGTIFRFDALRDALPQVFDTQVSSHGVGIPEAIELGRALDTLPAELLVYGIEAGTFETGAPLSPGVKAAIPVVAARIGDELAAFRHDLSTTQI